MDISFFSHGACREVTGSKHFIQAGTDVIQIDSGMFQGRRRQSYQKNKEIPFSPSQVESILLTHGHFDHSGALPIMINNGFKGDIFATPATRDIADIILLDSAYIQKKDYEYIQEKKSKNPERKLEVFEPLYSAQDVVNTMRHFVTLDYHKTFRPASEIEASFYDAGHILGSSMIYLNIHDQLRVGFSGDLGRQNLPIIRDPEIMPAMDYLILEGTYGDRLHQSIEMGQEELGKIINQTVRKKGKIIIPAFTIERTQELIYFIHSLLLDKQIPPIPIFIDSPMAVNATAIFATHPECFDSETYENFISQNINPFGFDNIKYIVSTRDSIDLNSHRAPAIIISASGMAENGRILHHLRNNIEDPSNTVAIVGYMAEHTLGRKLVEGHKEIKIFGKKYKVKARIKTLNTFSGHADYREIISWLDRHDTSRLKKIFLVHGEEKALNGLSSKLISHGMKSVEIAEYDRVYRL
jgi:metallo-beta-lactamase family protein